MIEFPDIEAISTPGVTRGFFFSQDHLPVSLNSSECLLFSSLSAGGKKSRNSPEYDRQLLTPRATWDHCSPILCARRSVVSVQFADFIAVPVFFRKCRVLERFRPSGSLRVER